MRTTHDHLGLPIVVGAEEIEWSPPTRDAISVLGREFKDAN
jgi:hypothetical protein